MKFLLFKTTWLILLLFPVMTLAESITVSDNFCDIIENDNTNTKIAETVTILLSNFDANTDVRVEIYLYDFPLPTSPSNPGERLIHSEIVRTNNNGAATFDFTPQVDSDTGVGTIIATQVNDNTKQASLDEWFVIENLKMGTADNGRFEYTIYYFTANFNHDHTETDNFVRETKNALIDAYNFEVINWGFRKPSIPIYVYISDGRYSDSVRYEPNVLNGIIIKDITYNAALKRGNAWIFFRSTSVNDNYDYTNEERIDVGIIHEFTHTSQFEYPFNIEQWNWDFIWEGTARFIPTVAYPNAEHQKNTIFYNLDNRTFGSCCDVNHFMENPDQPLSEQTYQFALYWGFIYQKTQENMGIIEKTFGEVGNVGNDPNTDAPDAITRALQAVGSIYSSFEDSYKAFGVAVYKKDFNWTGKNWGMYLKDVVSREWDFNGSELLINTDVDNDGTNVADVNPWGIDYHIITPSSSVMNSVVTFDGEDSPNHDFAVMILGIKDSTFDEYEITLDSSTNEGSLVIDFTDYDKIVVIVIGLNYGGRYSISLSIGVDVVLVIDRSGSMWGSKIAAAKSSATMFVDLMQVNDKVGVVPFSSSAYVAYPLTTIDEASSVKTAAKNAISRLYASGMTSIGGGLQTGQNQLTSRGADDPVWAMVLLSDGRENTPPMVKDVLPGIVPTKTRIYSIGLGRGADEALLNTIALSTGGFYRFSPSGAELATIYQDIQKAVAGFQGIVSYISNILQGVKKAFSVGIDSSVLRAVFTASIGGSDIDLVLVKPDGSIVDPSVAATDPNITFTSGDNYESYSIILPMPGEWQMQVTGVDVAPGGEPITVSASGSTDLTLSLDFDKPEYLPNEPIYVIAELKDSLGPILGADVMTTAQSPTTTATFNLYDDGAHGDGIANDGIYANSYTNTSQRGSYTFKVDASGTSNTGEAFTRTATKSTVVGRDSDNDGIPDVWEDIYGLDKYRDDSAEDPDNDGLTNLEEYNNRTHPFEWDTDGDGYSDGQEVAAGSDPLEPNSMPAIPGDLDHDGDVDRDDLNIILAARNTPAAGPDDPRDLDGDGMITALDARKLVILCTRPRCATE